MKRLMLALIVCSVSTLSAQSLGEIAAKTAATKTDDGHTKPIAKTYTNDDLKNVTPIAPITPDSTPTIFSPASSADAAARKDLRDEIYWRNRLAPLLDLKARYAVHYEKAVEELRQVTPPWPQQGDGQARTPAAGGVPLTASRRVSRRSDARADGDSVGRSFRPGCTWY